MGLNAVNVDDEILNGNVTRFIFEMAQNFTSSPESSPASDRVISNRQCYWNLLVMINDFRIMRLKIKCTLFSNTTD